jgi:hypothetical protein
MSGDYKRAISMAQTAFTPGSAFVCTAKQKCIAATRFAVAWPLAHAIIPATMGH